MLSAKLLYCIQFFMLTIILCLKFGFNLKMYKRHVNVMAAGMKHQSDFMQYLTRADNWYFIDPPLIPAKFFMCNSGIPAHALECSIGIGIEDAGIVPSLIYDRSTCMSIYQYQHIDNCFLVAYSDTADTEKCTDMLLFPIRILVSAHSHCTPHPGMQTQTRLFGLEHFCSVMCTRQIARKSQNDMIINIFHR